MSSHTVASRLPNDAAAPTSRTLADFDSAPIEFDVTRTRPRPGVTLCSVSGIVDSVTGLDLRKTLLTAIRTAEPTIVVDLSGVKSLGVVGLNVLQETLAWAEPWHRVRLVTGSAKIERLLRVSGLSARTDVFERIDDAVQPRRITCGTRSSASPST